MGRWDEVRYRTYDDNGYTREDCPYDDEYGWYRAGGESPRWEASLQHPDTGWYLDMRWNDNEDGMLDVAVATVTDQWGGDPLAELDFVEIQGALRIRHDMLLFAKHVNGFYETISDLQEVLKQEGFSEYDI